MNNIEDNCPFSWDMLDVISRDLDFDDLFQFSGVCKNWREFHKTYWKKFLASQEPLLIKKSYHDKKSFSFISIADRKVYHSKTINQFWHFAYFGSSSGYLIMRGDNNSFLLLNPFTRRKKVINTSTFKVNSTYFAYHVLLAFGKGSEEFVLVASCKSSSSLYVYQSRNLGWVTYLTMGNAWKVVDFVVFHNTIYVVTNEAIIGVLDLNSSNIKFLEMKSMPDVTSMSHLRLVCCDGQLLVVHIESEEILNVYKIDFSTMNYVKLETLGDIALFYASGEYFYALNNPRRWGFESNSLYAINLSSTTCKVCLGDDNRLPKYIKHDRTRVPPTENAYLLDWCFRHQQYEVDFSPDE
ncbi:putative quinoprotein amine dehydrogenase, beta chain [Medicago truncatula]|nr:putative quinoprotein amine dehydrogenase, beta chain [Medicago truncatula]